MNGWLVKAAAIAVALTAAAAALSACGSRSDGAASQSPAPAQTLTAPATPPPSATPSAAPSAGPTAAGFSQGELVAARGTDGDLYLAIVTEVGGGTITVTYADSGESATIAAADARPIPRTKFSVGAPVLAVSSKGRFAPGRVVKVGGATYVIAWNDGKPPSTVKADQVIAP